MTENEPPSGRLRSMAPEDPPRPYKTWRGTVVILSIVLVFLAAAAFVFYRWAQLQSFSPELRFEGYHRFSGTLLPPARLFASKMIKLRVAAEDGSELVLPPVPDAVGAARPLSTFPRGTCVEGYVNNSMGYLAQMMLKIEGTTYLLSGDQEWIISRSDDAE